MVDKLPRYNNLNRRNVADELHTLQQKAFVYVALELVSNVGIVWFYANAFQHGRQINVVGKLPRYITRYKNMHRVRDKGSRINEIFSSHAGVAPACPVK